MMQEEEHHPAEDERADQQQPQHPQLDLGPPLVLGTAPVPTFSVNTSAAPSNTMQQPPVTMSQPVTGANAEGTQAGATMPMQATAQGASERQQPSTDIATTTTTTTTSSSVPADAHNAQHKGKISDTISKAASMVAPTTMSAARSLFSLVAPDAQQESSASAMPAHWFYQHPSGQWVSFSKLDSESLEAAHLRGDGTPILVDGGLYSANAGKRIMNAVYWDQELPTPLVRATWTYGPDRDIQPFSEAQAQQLETAYQNSITNNKWPARIDLDNDDVVVLRHQALAVLYPQAAHTDKMPEPRHVRRGVTLDAEPGQAPDVPVDHLFLVVAGPKPPKPSLSSLNYSVDGSVVGSFQDAVANMQTLSGELVKSHFEISETSKSTGRTMFLPVVWQQPGQDATPSSRHALNTAGALRKLVQEAVEEAGLYSALPQSMVDAVAAKLDDVIKTFMEQHPNFAGSVSLVGHGVGGAILLDILSNQSEAVETTSSEPEATDSAHAQQAVVEDSDEDVEQEGEQEQADTESLPSLDAILEECDLSDLKAKLEEEEADLPTLLECSDADFVQLGLNLGKRKKLAAALRKVKEAHTTAKQKAEERKREQEQKRAERRLERRMKAAVQAEERAREAAASASTASVKYPKLSRAFKALYLLGSPFALLSECGKLNDASKLERVSEACEHVYNVFHPYDPLAFRLETLLFPDLPDKVTPVQVPHYRGRKRVHLELQGYLKGASRDLQREVTNWAGQAWSSFSRAFKERTGVDVSDKIKAAGVFSAAAASKDDPTADPAAILGGQRLDFVLQESPTEAMGQTLFAVKSHQCYWTSEDTVLFLLTKSYTDHAVEAPQSSA